MTSTLFNRLIIPLLRISAVLALAAVPLLVRWARAGESQELARGAGQFQFVDDQGNRDRPITVWTYVPKDLRDDSPVVFVMHGVHRNGQGYRDNWVDHARKMKFLLVVPEFSEKDYPGDTYATGNMLDKAGNPIDPAKWAFTAIERLFDRVKAMSGNKSKTYFIYGHSAGGQFVHRFMLFMPNARYQRAIAANPGYYTLPALTIRFPYGLAGTVATEASLSKVLSRDFVLLLGEKDIDPNDPNMRKTPEANAQGKNRFQRGHYFFQQAKDEAARLNAVFSWRLGTVPDAAHSDKQMSEAAAKELFKQP
jgi:poly(3-hydroxybutyrate) depolymerase